MNQIARVSVLVSRMVRIFSGPATGSSWCAFGCSSRRSASFFGHGKKLSRLKNLPSFLIFGMTEAPESLACSACSPSVLLKVEACRPSSKMIEYFSHGPRSLEPSFLSTLLTFVAPSGSPEAPGFGAEPLEPCALSVRPLPAGFGSPELEEARPRRRAFSTAKQAPSSVLGRRGPIGPARSGSLPYRPANFPDILRAGSGLRHALRWPESGLQ